MTTPDRLFLPWARRGFAGTLETAATLAAMPARAPLSVSVEVEAGAAANALSAQPAIAVDGLRLMGPGDVAGLGAGAVLRSDPPDGTPDMFPNLMPSVEFKAPDMPWMFTPAGPDEQGNLTPWIVLICVEEGAEATLTQGADARPVLRVAPDGRALAGWQGALPDPQEAWAWAHVQISGVDAAAEPTVAEIEARLQSGRGVTSRLLCPRNLSPETSYICAVVPLFEAGRAAALGLETTEAQGPAWTTDRTEPLDLPVFHHWRFSTTRAGDFEALARLIAPSPLGADVGRRAIDIQRPALPVAQDLSVTRAPAAEIAQGDGQLGGPAGAPRDLPFPAVTTAQTAVLEIGGALRPVRTTAPAPPADPLHDALSGAMDQQQGPEPVIGPPAWGHWMAGRAQRGLSGQPPAPAWLRDTATNTQARIAAGVGAEIVRRNQDALMQDIWSQFAAVEQINGVLDRARLSRAAARRLASRHLEMDKGLCPATDTAPPARIWDTLAPVMSRVTQTDGHTVAFATRDTVPAGQALRRCSTKAPGGTPSLAARRTVAGEVARHFEGLALDVRSTPEDDAALADLASAQAATRPKQVTDALDPTAAVKWQDARAALCAALDPATAQGKRVRGRLGKAVAAHQPTDDDLHPVLTWPDLRRPVSQDLQALSQDWLLPGLDRVPENSVSLLEPDPAFIEALMAGLNHEIGAEMLWRGFPTDRRGSPFRTFWDKRGGQGTAFDIDPVHTWRGGLGDHMGQTSKAPGLVLLLRGDLLRRFPETLIYAKSAQRRTRPGADAPWPDPVLDPDGAIKLPVFRSSMSPDVTFLGFDLTPEDAQAAQENGGWFFMIEGPPTEPRFGLDETLRYDGGDFGRTVSPTLFDAGAAWDPLYWGDLLSDGIAAQDRAAALESLTHIPITPPQDASIMGNTSLAGTVAEDIAWGKNAAHMAAITLQLDVRIAFHSDALIGGGAP